MDIHDILKQYWGYNEFRPLQQQIIEAVMDGRDTLALLPTGGGKSVCFQVPALAKPGLCLVVSPLIALMKDQVENLNRRGIPALAVYSGMNFLTVKRTLQNAAYGNYKFLYVSPERLETSLFQEILPAMEVNLLAVDEAHCIAQWGHDFRPPYLRIANLRNQLPGVPVLALTASATMAVQDEICTNLQFGDTHTRFTRSFERNNLSYSVFEEPSRQNKILEILKNVSGSSIIYCRNRKRTKELADLLQLKGISAEFYHAGLSSDQRNIRQENWINNKTRVIVSTNAFGMGIDKANVRSVIHYDVPDCLENYYQEAGRAGRDGKRAYAVLLYSRTELSDLKKQVDVRYPNAADIKQVYIDLMNYLQVPAGSGEGSSYNFDIAAFSNLFKLNILTATYAIKALEQEAVVSFNEMFFTPSTLVFTCSREQLEDFQQQDPCLAEIIKGVLRSYEGIFDFPVNIYEGRLAKFLRIQIPELKAALARLQDFGIVTYTAQNDQPQIILLQNRMYRDDYMVNNTNHVKRKTQFEKRVADMVGYIEKSKGCRSRHVAFYFTQKNIPACGICDNCINEKVLYVSTEEFKRISSQISGILSQKPVLIDDIFSLLKDVNKKKIWRVIDFLMAEKKLYSDKASFIHKDLKTRDKT